MDFDNWPAVCTLLVQREERSVSGAACSSVSTTGLPTTVSSPTRTARPPVTRRSSVRPSRGRWPECWSAWRGSTDWRADTPTWGRPPARCWCGGCWPRTSRPPNTGTSSTARTAPRWQPASASPCTLSSSWETHSTGGQDGRRLWPQ